MKAAIQDEIRTTLISEKGVDYYHDWLNKSEEERETVELTGSYDAGWQRAASRRLYNSRSGHAFIIRQYTRKIIGSIVFSKNCKKCELSLKKIIPTYLQSLSLK